MSMQTFGRWPLRWTSRRALAGLALAAVAWGCSVTQKAQITDTNYCAFLGANLCAQLVPGTKDQADLRYVNTSAPWTTYNKVLIEPVTFWGGDDTKFSPADQRTLTNFMYQAMEQQLATKFQVVTAPGPGVMTVQVAIDDATASTPVMRSVSLVEPHVRALATLKYLATGTFPFVGSCQAEAKVTDSVSGQVLAAAVSRRVGGGSVKDADQWDMGDAENAITYWAQKITTKLSGWTSGTPVS